MSALHCRAVLLLQKELFKLNQQDLRGIEAESKEENGFKWFVVLSGLKGTSWQDGKFKLEVLFDEEYDITPPEVRFLDTVPFHPNVSFDGGQVCLGCLENWQPGTSITSVFLSLQQMLSEPYFREKPWNMEAVDVIRETPKRYKQLVLDSVLDSKRSTSSRSVLRTSPSSPPEISPPKSRSPAPKETTSHVAPPRNKSSEKLSYESYLESWKSLGTTQPRDAGTDSTTILKMLSEQYKIADDATDDGLSQEIYQQLSDHRKIMYGSFNNGSEEEKNRKRAELLKVNKVQLLKDLHANRISIKNLRVSLPSSPIPVEDIAVNNDIDDNEETGAIGAKELLEWTHNLPSSDFY